MTVPHIDNFPGKMNMSFKDKLIIDKLPKHVAVIMDGNGRWAQQRGNQRIFGHKNAITAVREVVEAAAELGIGYLTLYAFSTENWSRPKNEVNALMELLISAIQSELDKLAKNNIRLITIGDMQSLPKKVIKGIELAIEKTKNNTGLTLIIALSYSSHWEITEAVRKIAFKIEKKQISSNQINEKMIEQHLNTANFPNPELLIRTSGEIRISNFLLWQLAYTELYFTKKLWPDMRKEDFFEAIFEFQQRERRFGKTSEQLEEEKKI
jgi:undecaprenyl diphosphate synthase